MPSRWCVTRKAQGRITVTTDPGGNCKNNRGVIFRTREGDAALRDLSPDRLMQPSSVADAYWALYQQPKDAWTFEMDIRPFGEKW